MADDINLANQKAGEALRNSSADGPRKDWGNEYGFISGRVHEDGTAENLYLSLAGFNAFDETVERLLKVDNFGQAVGRNAIASQLATFLRGCNGRNPKGGLLGAFNQGVIEPLRQSIHSWDCLIPLVNFRVKNPLTVANVTFLSKEDARKEIQRAAGTTQADALFDELESVEDEDRVDAFAKANIQAHEMYRGRLAEETVLVAINMLRALAPRLNPFDHALLCGLRTEVPRSGTHSVLSVRPGTDIADIRHDSDDSVLGNFCVYEENLRRLRDDCEFDALVAIAAKPSDLRTSLESAIFTSVQTLGQSMVAGSIGPAFSGCVAALECLAKPASQQVNIKATFASNLKRLFGGERKARDAYVLRSEFVHTGLADIDVKDLRAARRCAIDLIVLALSKVTTINEHIDFVSQCLG